MPPLNDLVPRKTAETADKTTWWSPLPTETVGKTTERGFKTTRRSGKTTERGFKTTPASAELTRWCATPTGVVRETTGWIAIPTETADKTTERPFKISSSLKGVVLRVQRAVFLRCHGAQVHPESLRRAGRVCRWSRRAGSRGRARRLRGRVCRSTPSDDLVRGISRLNERSSC